MKILAIRGCNLASLAGEFEIDLARGPLADAGVFAIVGNTGAGKSTLLDALCVALFDRTPRLTNHSRVVVGRGDDDPGALGAQDARTLLRRGAAAGWAEVDFESGDARRYRARWSVRRARNQTDGALQDQQLSLVALDGGERLGGTKTETLKAIVQRLGLTFDQFRRSALLAQGEFAAFLRADGKDRSELLERMTGTEVYSRLSVAAHVRATLAEQRLRDGRAAALAIPVLDDTVRAATEAELALATDARTAARARLAAADEAARWLAESEQRRAAAERADSEHAAAVARASAADADRADLALRRRAEAVRAPWEAAARIDRQLAIIDGEAAAAAHAMAAAVVAQTAIATRRAELAALHEPIRAARIAARVVERPTIESEDDRTTSASARTDGARGAAVGIGTDGARGAAVGIGTDGPRGAAAGIGAVASIGARAIERGREALDAAAWLGERAALAPEIVGWPELEARFGEVAVAADAVRAHDRVLAGHGEARVALAATRETLVLEHQAATARLGEAQRRAATYQQRRGLTLEAARRLEDQARTHVKNVERLVAIAAAARASVTARAELERRLAELDDANRADLAQRAELEAAHATDAMVRGERARSLDDLRRAAGYVHARSELRDGEPCPLCGAADHPWRDRGAFHELVRDAGARLAEVVARMDATAAALATLAARSQHRLREHERLEGHRTTAITSADAAVATWREQLAALGELILEGDPSTPAAEALAHERDEAAKHKLDAARAMRHQTEAATKAAADAQAEAQLAQAGVDQLAARLAELDKRLAELDASVARVRGERLGRLARMHELDAAIEATLARWASGLGAAETTQRRPRSKRTEALVRADVAATPHGTRTDAAPERDPRAHHGDCAIEAAEATLREHARHAGSNRAAATKASDGAVASEHERGVRKRGTGSIPPATPKQDDLRAAAGTIASAWTARADRVATAEAALAGALAAIDREARENERAVAEHAARRTEGERRRAGLATELAAAALRLDDARAAAGFGGDADARDELRRLLAEDPARVEMLAEQLAVLERAVELTRAVAAERRSLFAEHAAREPAGIADAGARDELAAAAATADEHVARVQAALAADADARVRKAAALALLAAIEADTDVDRVLAEVIGSHDGKMFRSFAQSLTLDGLLAVANAHLDELAPRYQLERVPRHDLELQVIDRDLGAEVRSVQSLSGGESFLVSLALALGLSSMSAHDVRVRTLLVDEGFGTLDPATLDAALSVLDALQATGRQVGVISHVPALVERVGAHVRVIQRGGGRSEVVVA